MITLPKLPYAFDALQPVIDAKTVEIHYTKHHQGYVDKLNGLLPGTEFETVGLEDIVKKAPAGPIFNNAAQVWNHTFYRESLTSPKENNISTDTLAERIIATWGSLDAFKEAFSTSALNNFGSGWTWLVKDKNWTLKIINTSNAGCPLTEGLIPLLTIDVWEHAYYLNYQNRRADYISQRWSLVNWDIVQNRYA